MWDDASAVSDDAAANYIGPAKKIKTTTGTVNTKLVTHSKLSHYLIIATNLISTRIIVKETVTHFQICPSRLVWVKLSF